MGEIDNAMNILIITNVLPFPLDSGGAQAQYNFIDRMRHDHHVTLLWIQTTSRRQQYIPSLQQRWPEVEIISFSYRQQLLNPRFLCDKALRAFNLKCRPNSPRFQAQRVLKPYGLYASQPLIRFINNAIRQRAIDLVELNFYPCLQLAAHLPASLPKVFIHHELRYIRNERLLKNISLTSAERLQQQAVKRQELADLARCNAVVTLTDIDRQLLLQEGVTVPVYTSPAAVMTEAKAMIKTEAQSAVKTKAQAAVKTEAQAAVKTEAQSAVKTKASQTTNSTASDNASSLSTDTAHWNG